MISNEDVDRIAAAWIEEFSVEPYVLRQRAMDAWFELHDLIMDRPHDALLVLERMADKDLINWTFEGLAAGPLRSFLMLHGARYDAELTAIRQRNEAFSEMHALAVEGM